jgi:hypothetical protein
MQAFSRRLFILQGGSKQTILFIAAGLLILITGGFYETRTTREPLFPSIAFKDPTIVIILVITFLHNVAFTAGTFYLVLYFQVSHSLTAYIDHLYLTRTVRPSMI